MVLCALVSNLASALTSRRGMNAAAERGLTTPRFYPRLQVPLPVLRTGGQTGRSHCFVCHGGCLIAMYKRSPTRRLQANVYQRILVYCAVGLGACGHDRAYRWRRLGIIVGAWLRHRCRFYVRCMRFFAMRSGRVGESIGGIANVCALDGAVSLPWLTDRQWPVVVATVRKLQA